MSARTVFASLTRISNLDRGDFELKAAPRDAWRHADYVAARVRGEASSLYRVELANGRLVEVLEGMRVIGALGRRAATLEATGDWEHIGADGLITELTGAGLFGKLVSLAPSMPRLMTLEYQGHLFRDGRALNMRDFVAPVRAEPFSVPTILLIGTSMSAGKTTTGRVIIHELKRAGLRVAGAKLTGAGRYRDVLSYSDAGADCILDFVDAGLPSTVVPEDEFEPAMHYLLSRIAAEHVDVLVAEAGASPLEPYNGAAAVRALQPSVCCSVLCASDPYAVLGVQQAFGFEPDLVTGPTANTEAGIALVKKLTGLTGLNLIRQDSLPALRRLLADRLDGCTSVED
jgi:hypothetical protein